MILRASFLVAFVGGLGLGVYAMLHGVERSKGSVLRRPARVLNTPSLSVFATVFGGSGYLLLTRTTLGLPAVISIAMASGVGAAATAIILIARWALPYYGAFDSAEAIQGLVAQVTRAISSDRPGEIAFQADGITRTLVAESVQGSEIPQDAEVVIDTVRDGIARVELWSVVEQRL